MRSFRHLPIVALAALALLWGYGWVPGKLGVVESSAFVFAALRTFPAYLILLALLPLRGLSLRPKAVGLTTVFGILQVAGFVGLTTAALATGGAGHTAMLANTWQFWILILAWLVLDERLARSQWLSVAIGLVGLVLIIEPWQLHGVLSSLLTLAGALCFAAGAVVGKVLRRRHEVELLSLTAWQGLLGSIPLVVAAFAFPGQGIQWSATFVWSLAYSIVLGTALASVIWLYVLHALPANIAGLGTIGTPVVGVLASWILLGEDLSPAEIAGMVLVVTGLSLLVLWGGREAGWRSGIEAQDDAVPKGETTGP